jgi:phage-related minor tail protein
MYAVGFKINPGPIQDAEKKVGGLTKGIVSLGAVAASVGIAAVAAIGGIGIAAVRSTNDYERAMSRIQQSTGASTEMMEQTRGMAKDLYNQNLGEDWNDLGKALTVTSKLTKLQGEELKGATKNALLMREVFGFDIPETVKTSSSLVKNFGINSQESFNLLAQGAQRISDNPEFLDTVNEYSVHFRALGFTANEVMDTVAAGFDAGALNIDKVGDAVKEFTIRSKDMSKTSGDAYKMLGLDSDKMFSTFAKGGPEAKKAFTTVLQMISDVEDPVARNTIGVALLGSQFEDLEAPVIAAMGKVQSQFDMTKDTMGEINKIKFKSIGDAMKMFGRQVETGFLIPLGQKILPYLDRFGQWLTDNQPQIEKYGTLIADKFGAGLAIAANEVKYFLNNIDKFLPYITAALGPGSMIITAFTYLFKNNVNGMATGASESWVKIKAFFDSFMEKVNIVMPYILTAIGIVWPVIKSIFLTNLTVIWTAVKFAFDMVLSIMTVTMDLAWSVFSLAWDNITGVISIFKQLIEGDFAGAWQTLKDTIANMITGIGDIFAKFVSGWATIGGDFIQGIINGIKTAGPALWESVKAIGQGMKDTITDFFIIKSPSRVMMDIGGFVGEGMALGIDGTGGMVNEASAGLAEQVISPYQDAGSAPVLAPATAAAVTNNTSTTQAGTVNAPITITVHVSGDASDKKVGTDLAAQIAAQVQQALKNVIESAGRRQGLEANPG